MCGCGGSMCGCGGSMGGRNASMGGRGGSMVWLWWLNAVRIVAVGVVAHLAGMLTAGWPLRGGRGKKMQT